MHAQTESAQDTGHTFTARVLEITNERTLYDEFLQQEFAQQDLRLRGEDGAYTGFEFEIKGVTDIQVVGTQKYAVGDRVLVAVSTDYDGATTFYVVDFVRTNSLILLGALFITALMGIGWWKGVKAAVSLATSFFIILKFIIPNILAGSNPVTISIIGAVGILFIAIYLTEGWNRFSHIAMASVIASLVITGFLSHIFTGAAHLTGTAMEEAMFLLGQFDGEVNFRGLLLAGVIIGTLGVLDDVIISQVASVQQILRANPHLDKRELFRRAYEIGVSHIGSVTNTLFLVYAGSALPLLILFSIETERQLAFSQIVNLEQVATEIVRALVGSIGIILAMPIATALAAYTLRPDTDQHGHAH